MSQSFVPGCHDRLEFVTFLCALPQEMTSCISESQRQLTYNSTMQVKTFNSASCYLEDMLSSLSSEHLQHTGNPSHPHKETCLLNLKNKQPPNHTTEINWLFRMIHFDTVLIYTCILKASNLGIGTVCTVT